MRFEEGDRSWIVPFTLQLQNVPGQFVDRGTHAVRIDAVLPGCRVSCEGVALLEVVECEGVGPPMRAGRPEAHRTKYARKEGHVVPFWLTAGRLAGLRKPSDQVQADNVRLGLLECGGSFLERLPYRASTMQRILDPKPVSHLVEHRVREEGVESDHPALLRVDQKVRDWQEYVIELGAHRVLQLKATRPHRELDFLVVRQVDGYRLCARIAIAGVVQDVVRVQLGVSARRLGLVAFRHGQAPLHVRQHRGVLCQPVAPIPVLDQHVRLEGGLGAEERVLVRLDGSDD